LVKEYTVENIKIKILLINGNVMIGTVNMAGYDRFSDFIEKDESNHIKLTEVTINGNKYAFMIVSKEKVLGYIPPKPKK